MSGDHTTGELDLDAIMARTNERGPSHVDVEDLVAEVRRLRVEQRRRRSNRCGCAWCCSGNADSVIPGDAHLACARYAHEDE